MNILRIIGVIIGLIAGLMYLPFAYVMLGWGWSDSGCNWSFSQWVLALIPWSMPYIFTFWIVYRCFCTEEMEYYEIFSRELRPKALKRALLAEGAALLVGLMILYSMVKIGRANYISSRVLLEQHTQLVNMRDTGKRPQLPLPIDAVGIEAPDGKFTPVMFLIWPGTGQNYKGFTVDLKTGTPRLKIYRGTNEIAASNHFLGEFQIEGYSKTKPSLDGTVFFMLSEQNQLLMEVHEAEHNNYLKVKRVDKKTNE